MLDVPWDNPRRLQTAMHLLQNLCRTCTSAIHRVDALDVLGHMWAMEMSTCLDYYDCPSGSADASRLRYWGLNARLGFWSPCHYIWSDPFQWISDSLVYHNYPLPCVIDIQTKWSSWLNMTGTANIACAQENDRDLFECRLLDVRLGCSLHFSRSFLFAVEELYWTCRFYLCWTNQPNSLHNK